MPGRKCSNGTLRWGLLPFAPLRDVVKVLTHGAVKYAPESWRKVPDWRERYFDAAMRHLVAWREGERLDGEWNLPHLAHAVCCLLFLAALDIPGETQARLVKCPRCDKPWETDPAEDNERRTAGLALLVDCTTCRMDPRWPRAPVDPANTIIAMSEVTPAKNSEDACPEPPGCPHGKTKGSICAKCLAMGAVQGWNRSESPGGTLPACSKCGHRMHLWCKDRNAPQGNVLWKCDALGCDNMLFSPPPYEPASAPPRKPLGSNFGAIPD